MKTEKGLFCRDILIWFPEKFDKVFDFEKDSIEPMIDGEWVTADGTTLGADNGMGVAATMAVLT